VKDWPDHEVPAGATTADQVFPRSFGIDAPRVLAHTNREKSAQEAEMVKAISSEVEEYNTTVPSEKQLTAYKAFEGSKADMIICLKGTEVYCSDGETLDITSDKMIWEGLQVKTGSAVLSERTTNLTSVLSFNNVDNYGKLIGLVCVNHDNHDETFYFDQASRVEEYSRANMLSIPTKPSQKRKVASIQKLRANHQIKFAALPAKLFELHNSHVKSLTLMSWGEANNPAAKGESGTLKATLFRLLSHSRFCVVSVSCTSTTI
jgi:hypothetical protein